ncbi:hypothetical protein GCM10027047_11690 [Rhodococcus aerolatus]
MSPDPTPLVDLLRSGAPVALVRVARREGLGSVVTGELRAVTPDAAAGALLGGAVDADVAVLAARVLGGEPSARAHVPLGERDAVAAGLACAGSVDLLAHEVSAEQAGLLADALAGARAAAVASDGARSLVLTAAGRAGDLTDAEVDAAAAAGLRAPASSTALLGDVLLDVVVPVPHLLVVGAGALGDALHAQAAVLGWTAETTTGVAETERAVAALGPADALVLLDHGTGFDAALLACARGPAFAGALGSRHTQAARRERLLALGADEAELAAVHGPVGLDLGARTPAETAVSVVAQVIAERAGRRPAPLAEASGRIRA